jgi:hypothetical protein
LLGLAHAYEQAVGFKARPDMTNLKKLADEAKSTSNSERDVKPN